jgi:hypothetical protein
VIRNLLHSTFVPRCGRADARYGRIVRLVSDASGVQFDAEAKPSTTKDTKFHEGALAHEVPRDLRAFVVAGFTFVHRIGRDRQLKTEPCGIFPRCSTHPRTREACSLNEPSLDLDIAQMFK